MCDFFEGCLVTGVCNPFVPVPVCVPVPDFLRTFAFSGTHTGTHTGTKGLCKPDKMLLPYSRKFLDLLP